MPSGDAAARPAAPALPGEGDPAADDPPGDPGFDVTPPLPAKPRPAGLSPGQKGYLALAMVAVLGAVALAVDILAAKEGNPPTKGLEELAEGLDDGGAASGPSRSSSDGGPPDGGAPGQPPAGAGAGEGHSDPGSPGDASGPSTSSGPSGSSSGSSSPTSSSSTSSSSTGLPTSLPLTESLPPVP